MAASPGGSRSSVGDILVCVESESRAAKTPVSRQPSPLPTAAEDGDENQIVERLGWTPRQRLDYLLDMLAFEERARAARVVRKSG